jgi:hypothetical protein
MESEPWYHYPGNSAEINYEMPPLKSVWEIGSTYLKKSAVFSVIFIPVDFNFF